MGLIAVIGDCPAPHATSLIIPEVDFHSNLHIKKGCLRQPLVTLFGSLEGQYLPYTEIITDPRVDVKGDINPLG